MSSLPRVSSGIAFIAVLIVASLVLSTAVIFLPKTNLKLSLSPTPISAPTPTPLRTPLPTPVPTPTPLPSPKATEGAAKPTPTVSGYPGSGHSRINVATERGTFLIDVISIDMTGVRMITDTAADSDCATNCPTLPLAQYVARNGGFAGMNGTYFCPADYGECVSKTNSFDFPVYNSRLSKWINAGNLFWNDRSIVYFDGGGMHFLRNANSFSGGLSAGVVNHPGLVEAQNLIAEHFPLTPKQTAKGTKSGMGIRGKVVYLVIARNVDVLDLSHVFKALGADFALNLDGGGSVALWFGGYKVGPGRNLPNAIIFAR